MKSTPTPTRLNPQLDGGVGLLGGQGMLQSDSDSGLEGELDGVEQVSLQCVAAAAIACLSLSPVCLCLSGELDGVEQVSRVCDSISRVVSL